MSLLFNRLSFHCINRDSETRCRRKKCLSDTVTHLASFPNQLLGLISEAQVHLQCQLGDHGKDEGSGEGGSQRSHEKPAMRKTGFWLSELLEIENPRRIREIF